MRTVGVGEKDEISFENPGDYELITMNLIGPNIQNSSGVGINKIYGIQLIYTNFSIYEDLYSNCLTGSISILDVNSILSEFPIIGEEIIEIQFRSMNTEIDIHVKFRVTSISEIEKLSDGVNVYTLLLTSPVSIRNQKQKISRSFGGIRHKTHLIVDHICKTYLNLINEANVSFRKLGDLIIREKSIADEYYSIESNSGHSEKYIAPSITPFNVINNLCKRSINTSGSLYFFFEDINSFRFLNIEENSRKKKNKQYIKKYINFPNDTIKNNVSDTNQRWNIIIDYSIKKRFDVFENMERGMYSSEVAFLDVEKREHFTKKYFYQQEGAKYNHTSNGYLLASKNSDLLHNISNESPSTVAAIVPMHFGDRQSQDYTIHTHENFQRRMSMEAQMDGIIIEIQVPGDSSGDVAIGDFVHFSFMSFDTKEDDRMVEDPYMSGRYMVTRIRHHVTKETNNYTMVIEMISDTVFQEYDVNDKTVDAESISIKVEDEPMELEEDTIEVSTSKNSEIIVDAYNAIDRKRRNMKLGTTIVTEERKNV